MYIRNCGGSSSRREWLLSGYEAVVSIVVVVVVIAVQPPQPPSQPLPLPPLQPLLVKFGH